MLIYDVILDVGTTGCQQSVSLYQGDDRSKMLRITLLQEGRTYAVPSDMNVRLHGIKPDDTFISPHCGVRGGSVYYLPAAEVTGMQGTVLCQLQIRDHSGAILFTPEFTMQIVAALPIPELPEGAAEDLEYNAEVLSELSASADGNTLLFRGEPVSAVRVASVLPQSAEEDTIVYLIGDGLYRRANDDWTQLTADETVTLLAAMRQASHTHSNKSDLDRLAIVGGRLRCDGRDVGIAVVSTLPNDVWNGTIVYLNDSRSNGLFAYYDNVWTQISDDTAVTALMRLEDIGHYHENGPVLDTITAGKVTGWDAAAAAAHAHTNKTALDKLSDSAGELWYDGKPVGIAKFATGLPNAETYAGQIVYVSRYDIAGLYVSDGTSWVKITDNFVPSAVGALMSEKHTHTNKAVLDKFTESNGDLLYNGAGINGVRVVAAPNALSANASDGSVAVAVGNGTLDTPVAIPAQSGSGSVSVDIAGKNLVIGTPTYNLAAINAAIVTGDIDACSCIETEDGSTVMFAIMPVVSDIADNAFTNAGVTLDPDSVIEAQVTQKYAISMDWSGDALNLAAPDKIEQVDAGHIKIPISAIYTFEDLEPEDEDVTLLSGWNVLMATVDTVTDQGITDIEFETGVDVNDYIALPTSAANTMTVEGARAAQLFANTVIGRAAASKGLYVKLGAWKRLAEA